MDTPNFQAMSIDELVEYKLERKRQIEALKVEMRVAHVVYTTRVEQENVARRITAAGLDGKVIVPDVAGLTAEGK